MSFAILIHVLSPPEDSYTLIWIRQLESYHSYRNDKCGHMIGFLSPKEASLASSKQETALMHSEDICDRAQQHVPVLNWTRIGREYAVRVPSELIAGSHIVVRSWLVRESARFLKCCCCLQGMLLLLLMPLALAQNPYGPSQLDQYARLLNSGNLGGFGFFQNALAQGTVRGLGDLNPPPLLAGLPPLPLTHEEGRNDLLAFICIW